VVDGVLLRPLPLPQSDRLVNVWESNEKRNLPKMVAAPANYYDWRAQNNAFPAIGAYQQNNFNLAAASEPEHFPAPPATPVSSPRWASRLSLARTFTESENHPGQDGVVVPGYGVSKTRFGGDASIPGKPRDLNGRARTVIGVMPPGRPCWRTRLACRRSRFRLPRWKRACRWACGWRGVRMKTNYCWIWRCGWRKRAVHGLGHNE
jgi:putative ABC transport system permease protein